ncbi:peptide deformylase, partial [Staphylococcus saprophyticus]|uniref:peptide deformylase n=1 Tax=Staphylococcus saprophyticus TaxID=29385 RepID=UPI001642C9E5
INISKKIIPLYLPHRPNGNSYDFMLLNPKIITHTIQQPYLPTRQPSLTVHQNIPPLLHPKNTITLKPTHIHPKQLKFPLKPYPPLLLQHQIHHINGIIFYHHIHPNNPLHPHNRALEV